MTGRTIVVEVRDRDGDPVAGARVWITRAPVAVPDVAALTDGAGRAVFGVPAAGPYTVAAAAGETAGTATATAAADADVNVEGGSVTVAVVL